MLLGFYKDNPLIGNAIGKNIIDRYLERVPEVHLLTAKDWNHAMERGLMPYGRIISFDTRRIYFNAAQKFWHLLRPDYSNLYEATIKAIESHRPEQYSSKKHIKEAAISLCKYLIHKSGGNIYGF